MDAVDLKEKAFFCKLRLVLSDTSDFKKLSIKKTTILGESRNEQQRQQFAVARGVFKKICPTRSLLIAYKR
jgi:hypothetical protein